MKTDFGTLEAFRVIKGFWSTRAGERQGVFFIPRGKASLRVIATEGSPSIPWEHVSVCALDKKGERTPTWEEMNAVKDLFWDAEECVVQFHPPRSDYVNNHPHVLHLWKPSGIALPRPPSIAVGFRGIQGGVIP
jgi:hypothetical protein